jgi:hypothetical protein
MHPSFEKNGSLFRCYASRVLVRSAENSREEKTDAKSANSSKLLVVGEEQKAEKKATQNHLIRTTHFVILT